jgi:hypothetical protein
LTSTKVRILTSGARSNMMQLHDHIVNGDPQVCVCVCVSVCIYVYTYVCVHAALSC